MRGNISLRAVLVFSLAVAAMFALPAGAQTTENFDSYTAGAVIPAGNGWVGWGGDTANGIVTAGPANSLENSLAVVGGAGTDQVLEFGYEPKTGLWEFSVMTYLPSAGKAGETYFNLMNRFDEGGAGTLNWSLVGIHWMMDSANANADLVYNDGDATIKLPIQYDTWVEVSAHIDLDNDTCEAFYGGTTFGATTWSKPAEELHGIDVMDIYPTSGDASVMYYDDISLIPEFQLFWNGGAGTEAPADGAGTWNAANENWWDTASRTWADSAIASFGAGNGAAGDVAVVGTVKPEAIVFNAAGSGTYRLTQGTGGVIDLNANVVDIRTNADAEIQTVIDNGGLNKFGSGALTLSGANTYTGPTTVNAGTLTVDGSLASDVTVNLTGTLAGTGAIAGSVTVKEFAALAPGGSVGVLTTGDLTMEANSLYEWEIGPTAADTVVVEGDLTLTEGWSVKLIDAGGTPTGEYDLFTYTGSFTGSVDAIIDVKGDYSAQLGLDTSGQRVYITNVLVQLPTSIYQGDNNTNNDRWNLTASWDTGVVPTGAVSVDIPTGKLVNAWSASTPTYTGDLTIHENATVQLGWTTQYVESYNALGTPGSSTIYMYDGSRIYSRSGKSPTIPAIQMMGDAEFTLGASTQGGAKATFAYGINGDYTFTLRGKGDCWAKLTAASTFGELVADAQWGTDFDIYGDIAGSLGGDVTIKAKPANNVISANLIINATDAMADTATLSLFGSASTTKLTANFDDTIAKLFVDGIQQADGTYGTTGTTGVDYEVDWLAGSGILTVAGVPSAYWDLNDANSGAGGPEATGTWGTANTWNAASDGTGTTAAWTPGQTAYFAAGTDASGTYTVTVDGTQDIGGLSFAQGDVTLSGGALQMSADSLMRVASGAAATVATNISEDGSARDLSKGGDGALVLSGSNTYTGVTKVEGGTLSVSSLANAGAASNIGQYASAGADGLILAGGTLQYTGGTATTDRGFTLKGDSTIDVTTPGATLALGASESSDASSTLTVTGGTGSSLAVGDITVVKAANITFIPTTASVTVASVHSASLYGIPTGTLTLDGTASGNVITGGITKGSTKWEPGMNLVKSNTGSWTILGNVSSNGTVTVNDGTLKLAGSSSYSNNTTVNGGTLEVTGSISNSSVTVKVGGAIAGGGSVQNLTVNAGGSFTWSYGDGEDHTMDTGHLTLNDAWVLKFVDLGDDMLGSEQYDLLNFTGNYNGEAVTGAITLVEGVNYTLDTILAPEWNFDNIEVVVDEGLTEGFMISVTGITGAVPGDANGDGVVDSADYIMVKTHFGGAPAAGTEGTGGDFNGNGTVDWNDLQELMSGLNSGTGGAPIPEPATLALLAVGAMALIRRRRS